MDIEKTKKKGEGKEIEKERKKQEQRRGGCTLVCHSTLGRL